MNIVTQNGFGDIPIKEDNETFYDISSLSVIDHEDTSPVLRLLSYPIRYTLSTCLIISLVIGSYCKFVLYRYILISSKSNNGSYFKMTPINVLLFVSAIVNHLTNAHTAIFMAVTIGTDAILADAIGKQYCHVARYIVTFGIVHRVVDGFGISIYRLFCIKSSLLVKGQIQERTLFQTINFGGPVISTLLTLMYAHGYSSDLVMDNLCTGNSEFVAQMWLDLSASKGVQIDTSKIYKTIVACVLIGMTLSEVTCYIVFFYHCYKNDNGNIKKFLPKDVTRQRNQRNAITFLGQVYGFWTEFAFMLGTLILTFKSNAAIKEIGSMTKTMEFGLISAVEVLSSDPIRQSVFGK